MVIATNLDTGLSEATTSDPTGQYRILALPVGRYRLEATLAGFQKFVTTGIELTINEQRRVDITLQVGAVEQQIEVSAAPIEVETASTQLGQVVDEKKLLSLPLNGRSYIDLLGLQAGVVPTISSTTNWPPRQVSGELSPGLLSVNGQREAANAFLVNGADVSEGQNLGTAIIPNLDSVAEFRLITNSFDAEYGKFSGAVMNAITKSGTNGFHGAAFEFLRNDKLDAKNFFDPEKGVFRRNQFGYAVGGPAIKNKVFWFTDYQGTREVRGISTGIVQVPTGAEREGNFAGLNAFLNAAGNPTTVNGNYWAQILSTRLGYTVTNNEPYSPPGCTSTANCFFPGGIIPTGAFSAPAIGTIKYIPLPNTGANLFTTAGQSRRITDNKAGQRVDVINKPTGNWFIYYMFDDPTNLNPLPYANVPGFPSTNPTRAQQAVLSNTHIFGPSAVNEARLSFTREITRANEPSKAGLGSLSDLGFVTGPGTLGIVPAAPQIEGLPEISFNNFQIGNQHTTIEPNNTWHAADNFSKIYGQHTLKFGGDFRYYQVDERELCWPNGIFAFNGSETGSDFADYLLGAPVNYVQCSQQFLDLRTKYGGAYGQDSFVGTLRTVSFGLVLFHHCLKSRFALAPMAAPRDSAFLIYFLFLGTRVTRPWTILCFCLYRDPLATTFTTGFHMPNTTM
jgi:hypothetical protein